MNQEVMLTADLRENLRPHEQRLVMRQMAGKQALADVSDPKGGGLHKGLRGLFKTASRLCATQANWEMTPRKPILCETCKDKGYLLPKLTPRNQLNRRAYACPDCHVRQQEWYRESVRLSIRAKWPILDWVMDLGSREIILEHLADQVDAQTTLKAGLALAKEFAINLPEGGILSLNGPPGTAKTHLLAKIYRFCTLKGLICIYLTGSDLQQLFTDFGVDDLGVTRFYQRKADLIASDMLLIDEVDRISVKGGFGWSENELLDTIEKRINHKRPTALAGNNLKRLLKPVLSRCDSAGSYMLDLKSVPDGRAYFQGDGGWYKRALEKLV